MKRLSAVLISSLMSPHISAAPLFQYDAEQQFLNQQQRQKAQE